MEKHHEFCPADRYVYDFGLCSSKNGFAQIDTSQDASYFGTWANPKKLIIFNYCEGDCYTTICHTPAEFVAEIRDIKAWNEENGHRFIGIDPGLHEENIEAWKVIGLGDLLH
jgi:hypothetical protein